MSQLVDIPVRKIDATDPRRQLLARVFAALNESGVTQGEEIVAAP